MEINLKKLKYRPETYNTFLKIEKYFSTDNELRKLKRKLKKYLEFGIVFQGILKGGYRKKIFFSPQKKYLIVMVEQRFGMEYYYCEKIKDVSKLTCILEKAYLLKESDWSYSGDVKIFKGRVLKIL